MIGIDEVGRGALAGPVVVGAVHVPEGCVLPELPLRDSKKATKRMRELVAAYVIQNLPHAIGVATAFEVDDLGIVAATNLAATRSLSALSCTDQVRADAGLAPHGYQVEASIRADATYPEVMLAANLAKVWRDSHMTELSRTYSGYGWEQNAGYGTRLHQEALKRQGVTPEHRRSFCAMLLA